MALTVYNTYIEDNAVVSNWNRLTNQVFKMLPYREEGNNDWKPMLENLIVEIAGMDKLILKHDDFCPLLCKLKGIQSEDVDFFIFRKTIFECLSLMNKVKNCLV